MDYTGKVRVEKAGNGVKGEEENLVTMYKDGEMIASWEWWKEQPEDESWADDKTGRLLYSYPGMGRIAAREIRTRRPRTTTGLPKEGALSGKRQRRGRM